MNEHRHFWGELLLAVEDSLAAFCGVGPVLIGQSPAILKIRHRDDCRLGAPTQTSSVTILPFKDTAEGILKRGEEGW